MVMFDGAPPEDGGRLGGMYSAEDRTEFPSGAIAQAWMDVHSLRLTWDELTAWLGADPAA